MTFETITENAKGEEKSKKNYKLHNLSGQTSFSIFFSEKWTKCILIHSPVCALASLLTWFRVNLNNNNLSIRNVTQVTYQALRKHLVVRILDPSKHIKF